MPARNDGDAEDLIMEESGLPEEMPAQNIGEAADLFSGETESAGELSEQNVGEGQELFTGEVSDQADDAKPETMETADPFTDGTTESERTDKIEDLFSSGIQDDPDLSDDGTWEVIFDERTTTEWTTIETSTEHTTAWTEPGTEQTTAWTEPVTEQTTAWTEPVTEQTTAWTETGTEQTTDREEAADAAEQTTEVLEYVGSDYKVRLTYSSAAGIPDGAELEAEEISHDSREYHEYLEQAKAALRIDESTELPKEYARFFDIRILAKGEDGFREKIEPEDSVRVEIIYDEPVDVQGANTASVSVVHFDEQNEETNVEILATVDAAQAQNSLEGGETERAADPGDGRPDEFLPEAEKSSEEGSAGFDMDRIGAEMDDVPEETGMSVMFDATGFSVYGVIYTVDFTYESRTWSFPGQGSYRLTDVLAALGIEGSIDDAALTLFMGEDHAGALYLTQADGEYYINSDEAFIDTYELRVTVGEKVYLILVTDLQYTTSLNDVLTDLTISGAEWDPDTQSYTVKPGKTYTVNMTFEEGEGAGQYQFSNTDWMTLNLPDGVTFGAVGANFDIYVNEAGENYTIHGNQVVTDNGTIKIKLNDNDPNYQKLKDLTTAKFTISVTGIFSETHHEYKIDGQTDTHIKVDETPDVDVKKSGGVIDWNSDPYTAKVRYRLEVRSNGNASGVVITDTIQGTGLTYDQNAAVTLDGQAVTDWSITSQSATGFSMTTGTLEDGKTYIVEYTATLDKSKLVDNGDGSYSVNANNKVDWTGDKTTTHDLGHVVDKPGISKSGRSGDPVGSVTTTTWTIEADSDYGENNQLNNITDRIATDGVNYSGDGIHVVVTDRITGSTVDEQNIPWNQIQSGDGKSWTYDVSGLGGGNLNKKYHYTITYTTVYDTGSSSSGVNIRNDWEDDRDNEGTSYSWVNPNPENRYGLDKQFSSKESINGETIVTWTIKVTIPAAGLTAADAILTDVLPSTGSYQDTYYSFNPVTDVAGLYPGESVTADFESDPTKVVFTFKKGGNAGLWASTKTPPEAREIVLTLKTKCDPDWLNDTDAEQTHTNEAIFHGEHKYAYYTPEKPSIKKEGWRDGEEGGLPKFSYSVVAGVFSEDLFAVPCPYPNTETGDDNDGKGPYVIIRDTFDENLAYVDGSASVYGGNQYWQGTVNADVHEGVAATVVSNQITFKLYKDSLPNNAGNLFQYYKVGYSLKIKDQETLERLRNQAIADGKAVELGNTVTGFGGHNTTVSYEPKILDKTHAVLDDKLIFTITVNQEGLTLSDNGVLVLTDDMENLSVRYQDITIEVEGNKTVETTDSDGNPVTAPYFNMKGNRITFYLPDGAPITITYRATPRGEIGADGNIQYSNTVRLNGFEKTDSGVKTFTPEGAGYGTNYGVYIYKADGLVNSNALAGAVFKLYEVDEVDADGNIVSGTPVKTADGSDYTVTTSDGRDGSQKGVVLVMGNEELGWNLKPEKRYYLLEVKAPEGYALDNTKYSFIISKEGYVNYSSSPIAAPDGSGKLIQAWTYHNGDVMTVKDWRKDGVLTLEKSFDGIDPSTMDDDQKAALKFKIYTVKDGTETLWRTITYDQFTPIIKEDGTTGYTYTIGDLSEGTYKVVEQVDDVTCKETTYAITDTDSGAGAYNDSDNMNERYATIVISEEDVANNTENGVVISNRYEVPSEFKIYKHAEGETSHKLPGAEFGVFAVDENYEPTGDLIATYTTNSRGRFTILQTAEGGRPEFEVNRIYALKEIAAPDGFLPNEEVTYFYFMGTGASEISPPIDAPESTVVIKWKESEEQNIEDTPKTTYLEAEKIWLNELLEEDEQMEDSVRVRVRQIASYDREGAVIEPELSGYYNINSPTKPVTGERASVFQIVKDNGVWHLSGDGISEDGKLTGLPTMIFDNHIPIYYTYEVAEEIPAGYVPRYEYTTNPDGGTHAKVTNRPNNVTTTIQLKAQKKWVDINGADVTGKMGLDDGVKVGVYRYPGIIKAGKIYEQNGTEREPLDQFSMSFVDNNGRGTIDNTRLVCLPGDRIEIRITPKSFFGNATFDTVISPAIQTSWGAIGRDPETTNIKDEVNKQYIITFTANSSEYERDVTVMRLENLAEYTIEVKNLTAEGRRQVLTQSEAALLREAASRVETLELNMLNRWSAASGEYPVGTVESPYSYFLVEENGEGFDASYSMEGDVVTVTNVEKKIEVQKIWKAANGDDITDTYEDGSVTFKLYQTPYHSELETVSVNSSQLTYGRLDWGASFTKPLNNVTGDLSGIKKGSTVKITVTVTCKNEDNTSQENSPFDLTGDSRNMKVSGGTGDPSVEGPTYNEAIITKSFTLENVNDTIVLQGNVFTMLSVTKDVEVKVEVIDEPEIDTTTSGTRVEVGDITVTKDSASFTPTDDFKNIGITAKTGSEVWTAVLNKLPAAGYNDANEKLVYKYSVEETASEGFDVSITGSAAAGGKIEAVNRLKSGSLKVKKVVEGAAPVGKTYEIAVTDAEGNHYGTDGTNYGQTLHYEVFSANDEKTWTPLTPGTYTVSEKNASVEGYTWTVSGTGAVKVQQDETANATVTNSYFKNAEYTPKVTKSLKTGDAEVSPWPDGISFDFYLSFVSGSNEDTALSSTDVVMTNRSAAATETNKTAEFGEIEFKKPGVYIFRIEEVEPSGTHNHKKDGITYSTTPVTLTVTVKEKGNEPGVLEVVEPCEYSPADITTEPAVAGLITNTLDYPSYSPSVTKVLKNGETDVTDTEWGDKSFTFTLANTTTGGTPDSVIMPGVLTRTVTQNSANHKETFDAIIFKAAGDYTFTVTETVPGDATNAAGTKYSAATEEEKAAGGFWLNGVTYDGAPKSFTVTVAPDSDGNLAVTKVTFNGIEVTGDAIIGSGVTVENTLEKTDFEFDKIWLAMTAGPAAVSSDDLQTWPTGKSITVRLFRKNGATQTATEDQTFELIYTISDSGTPISPTSGKIDGQQLTDADKAKYQLTRTTADNITTFRTEKVLDVRSTNYEWVYYVEETEVPEDYSQDGYGTKSTSEADGTTITKNQGAAMAACGEVIMNRESSGYKLPETGGPGTRLFTILGSILTLGAGVLLWRRRRTI